jgi:hypothetical protein
MTKSDTKVRDPELIALVEARLGPALRTSGER